MNKTIKNSETPYFSTSPVQDQFGTLMVAFGITKQEKLAMDLFKKFIDYKMTGQQVSELIEDCYGISNTFCNWEKDKLEKSNIIL